MKRTVFYKLNQTKTETNSYEEVEETNKVSDYFHQKKEAMKIYTERKIPILNRNILQG